MARLPPFSSLIAFDAVARHGTLTSAAVELNVSQPAVSRRIATLEADLECILLGRDTRPLTLTTNGLKLFDVLRSSLSRIELVVDQLRRDAGIQSITISAASGIAAYWLIPRLPELQSAFPDVAVRIISQTHSEDTMAGDINIRFGNGDWPGINAIKIFGEEVFPVSSPLYLGERSLPLSLDTLKAARLLGMPGGRQPWYEWNSWFEAVGAPVRERLRILDFDSYALLVNAVLAGHGICLCWSGLLDAFLKSGALVRLTDASASSPRGYFVTLRADLPIGSPIRDVAEWLAPSTG